MAEAVRPSRRARSRPKVTAPAPEGAPGLLRRHWAVGATRVWGWPRQAVFTSVFVRPLMVEGGEWGSVSV